MDVNWLAVIVAAISTLIMGFIWYHPKVFGTAWMQESGMTEEKAQQGNMPMTFGATLVLGLLAAWGLAHYGKKENFDTFMDGAYHAGQIGLLFALPAMAINALFEQKSWRYILINAGYWVVTLAVMGGILSAWQ